MLPYVGKWSGEHLPSNDKNVSQILSILEDLDSYSSHSIDGLYSRLFGSSNHQQSNSESYIVVNTLCQWATTSKRSGENRAFIVAKLLERRQADMTPSDNMAMGMKEIVGNRFFFIDISQFDADEDNMSSCDPPYFQSHLFRYLDLDAPTLESPREFSNLVLLFYEFIWHDVFSHDTYLSQLISRGEFSCIAGNGGGGVLQAALSGGARGGNKDEEDADGSFEDSKINDDLNNILNQIKEGNQLGDQPFSSTTTEDNSSSSTPSAPDMSRLPRHIQYCYHFPLPPDESYSHELNQRHVILYGCAANGDGTSASKDVKKLCKEIMKLFGKKMSIDVSDGAKVSRRGGAGGGGRHGTTDSLLDGIVNRFRKLSYFDQHSVTRQCGQAVVEMLSSFAAAGDKYLPVAEYVSFIMDLAGLALNIQVSVIF